jgi:hypothetical protein
MELVEIEGVDAAGAGACMWARGEGVMIELVMMSSFGC